MEKMTEQEELNVLWESEMHYVIMLLEDHKKDVLDKMPKGKDPYGEKRLNESLTKKFQYRFNKSIGRDFW